MDSFACVQALQELTNQVDCLVSGAAKDAAERKHGVGNVDRASQKQQMRSLKSSHINLGQKLMFAKAAKDWVPNQPLKAEADKAAAAVEHAEDELKDWKNMAKQEEQQLQAGLAVVRSQYASYQAWAARMQHKLDALTKQEAVQQQAQAALDTLTATGAQGSSSTKLAQESARSAELEAQLAAARAVALQDELSLAAEQSHVAILQAAIRDLQSLEETDARELSREKGCREWAQRLSLVTGVKQVTLDARLDRLQVELHINTDGSSGSAVTHELHVQLQSGSKTLVSSASLQPATVDISAEVEAAARCSGGGGVAMLLGAVTRLLRQGNGAKPGCLSSDKGQS